MPRRRPHELRVRRSDAKKEPGLPRGSARLVSALAVLERHGLDSVAGALRVWRLEVRGQLVLTGCDHCDESPIEARRTLDAALRSLPPRPARELREMVAPLDALYVAKTVPDPSVHPDVPEWLRRMRS